MIAFLLPAFLLFGLLALPVIALYMLRLRRQEVTVSSTMLWQKLLRDREANTPWQRLRRNFLLLLQLMILLTLVLAIARPYIPVTAFTTGNVVIVLDGSASMLATDLTPNRFAEAREIVYRIIDDLANRDLASLILATDEPEILIATTASKDLLRSAVDSVRPDTVEPDWASTLALASATVQGYENARIVIVSDGGLPDGLPQITGDVDYIQVGSQGNNLAITALQTRDTNQQVSLFAQIKNYGTSDQSSIISIEIDGVLHISEKFDIKAGESANFNWVIPDTSQIISAHLVNTTDDYLEIDNDAWAIREVGHQRQVLLVSPGNRYLETLFSILPGYQLVRVPDGSSLSLAQAEEFDLVIYDGVALPDPLPPVELLLINPQPPETGTNVLTSPSIRWTGSFSQTAALQISSSPILNDVDWNNIHVLDANRLEAPWSETLVSAEGGPLMLAGEHQGQRILVFTFALQESDLPLQLEFPVLMANITNWFAAGEIMSIEGESSPGTPVTIIPDPGVSTVSIIKPDGEEWLKAVDGPQILFSDLDQPGLYTIRLLSENRQESVKYLVANLFSPLESSIGPKESINLGHLEIRSVDERDIGQREIWSIFVVLAFVIMIVEWWIFYRGTRLPKWIIARLNLGSSSQ